MTEKLSLLDRKAFELAIAEAQKSLDVKGIPVGASIADGSEVLGIGHNERVQAGDPIAHGEIACLRNAGRQSSYRSTTLYTTLSPCQMCSGAVLLFKIPRVVVGEAVTFTGNLGFLTERGVEVVLLNDERCIGLMREFQARFPDIWNEDIGES
ncbi:MAG TPA: nucleoside deaminase [Streptosporangiaceae bacterium]|nr:nucleoside deaminase [Streptosporangiaceae bacterium]